MAADGAGPTLLGAMLEHALSIAMRERGPADSLMSPNSKVSGFLRLRHLSTSLVGHTAKLGRRPVQRAGGDLSKQHRRWICRESQRGSTMEMQARQGGSQQQTHLQEALLPLILPTLPQPAIITGTGTDFQASLGSCAVPPFCTSKPRQVTCQRSFLSPASLIGHLSNFASSYSCDPRTNLWLTRLPCARAWARPPLPGRTLPGALTLARSSLGGGSQDSTRWPSRDTNATHHRSRHTLPRLPISHVHMQKFAT